MALLIMVVTTGFSISQHFCQGELLAFALFGKAEPCEMAMTQNDLPPCHNQDNTDRSDSSFAKKPCCENHDAAVAGQDTPTLLKNADNLVPSVKFFAAFTYIFFQDYLPSRDKDAFFAEYRPPLIERDIPVLIQSFLI
ncbi:MAG TPA: hypothetical protein VIR29_05685 [Anseongella sp.]